MIRLVHKPLSEMPHLVAQGQHEAYHLDWIVLGCFDADSVRDSVNLAELEAEILRRSIVRPSTLAIRTPDAQVFLLANPLVSLREIGALLEDVEQGAHLNEDRYWQAVAPLVQASWSSATLETRIQWIQQADADLAYVLERAPPDDVHTQIWRDLDD